MKTLFMKIYLLIAVTFLFSCVSPRVVDDLKSRNQRCSDENAALKTENEKYFAENKEVTSKNEYMKKSISGLERDTMIMGISLQKMTSNYNQINELYELLLQKNRELLSGNVTQTTKLMSKLQLTEEDLQKREDELKQLGRELNSKERNLENLQAELQKREIKVNELKNIIAEKDAAVNRLKNKVSDALYSYKNKGITVEEKSGKVYVSLESQLLFATGSTVVDANGKTALIKLAKVLEGQEDIGILVEGHTDTDKYKGGGAIEDNWQLSVLRATSVVRILTGNSTIDPSRITSAGRGEYSPVDPANTEAAKKKNRRIEVILMPDLDELYRVLETN